MTWNLTWGDPTASLAISSIDDTDSGWEWSGTDWGTSPPLVGRWYGATGQYVEHCYAFFLSLTLEH